MPFQVVTSRGSVFRVRRASIPRDPTLGAGEDVGIGRPIRAKQAEQERRGAAAKHRATTACEDRGHVVSVRARCLMTHAIHARIHADQAAFAESFRDPAAGRARRKQLPARDDAVLASGNRGNDPI
jgi:hypothetical protein